MIKRNRIEYKPKKWTCKCCGKVSLSLVPLNKICSYKCANELKQEKVEKEKATAKKVKSKLPKPKTLSQLDKELWKIFSLFIRKRDAKKYSNGDKVKCITCSNVDDYKNMDAGHFMSRKYAATKFDEMNVFTQCKACNIFGQGKQYEFSKALDAMFGPDTSISLLYKSKMVCKRDRQDYLYLIQEYKDKINHL